MKFRAKLLNYDAGSCGTLLASPCDSADAVGVFHSHKTALKQRGTGLDKIKIRPLHRIMVGIALLAALAPMCSFAQYRSAGEDFVIQTGTTTTNVTEKMRITQGGLVAIGMVTPTYQLDVSGTVRATKFIGDGEGLINLPSTATDRISTTGITSGAQLSMVVADKGAISFTLAGTAGAAYLHGTAGLVAPAVSTTTGNAQALRMLASIKGSSAVTPSFSWTTDPDTGIYRSTADTLGFSTGGAARMTLGTSSAYMSVPLSVTSFPALDFYPDEYRSKLTLQGNYPAMGNILQYSNLNFGHLRSSEGGISLTTGLFRIQRQDVNDVNYGDSVTYFSRGFIDFAAPHDTDATSLRIGYASDTHVTIAENGYVGIGTSSPTERLSVLGNNFSVSDQTNTVRTTVAPAWTSISATSTGYGKGFGISIPEQTWHMMIGGTTGPTGKVGNFFIINATQNYAPALMIASDTSYIGINSLSPEAMLDVRNKDTSGSIALFRSWNGSKMGIAQNLVGGTDSLELTTADDVGVQATRMLIKGGFRNPDVMFYRGSRGSEIPTMQIQGNTGYVGIGKINPSYILDVEGTGSFANLLVSSTDSEAAPGYSWNGDSDTGLWRPAANTIGIVTAGTESVRITAAGRVGIGTTAPATLLHVSGTLRVQNGSVVTCNIGTGTGATSCTSDARLKKSVQPIAGALEKISRLNGVTFHWKAKDAPRGEHIGVIAQDVEKVFPQAVETMETGMKTVDYSVLVAPLIEAVKDLKTENQNLRVRLDQLESRVK